MSNFLNAATNVRRNSLFLNHGDPQAVRIIHLFTKFEELEAELIEFYNTPWAPTNTTAATFKSKIGDVLTDIRAAKVDFEGLITQAKIEDASA